VAEVCRIAIRNGSKIIINYSYLKKKKTGIMNINGARVKDIQIYSKLGLILL